MKNKGMLRRQMMYGFCTNKDTEGLMAGSAVVRLVRRNAYELIGLRRPAIAAGARWKVT